MGPVVNRSTVTLASVACMACVWAGESLASSVGMPNTPTYNTAISPIFGYDPVYGTILGGAWFRYPVPGADVEKPRYQEVFAQGTFGGQFSVNARQRRADVWPGWDHTVAVSVDNYFDYEFPEGESDYERYDRWKLDLNNELDRSLTEQWSTFGRLSMGYRHHERDGETLFAYPGVGVRWDSRDSGMNPRQGGYAVAAIDVLPDVFHSDDLDATGWSGELDVRRYVPLFEESVLALRAEGEVTDGDVFEATLGGDRQLRGYVARRFVGDNSLATQAELRFPIIGWVSGVTFVETGWIESNGDWDSPASAGGGLRFGLPPDGEMKVRADLGVSEDGEMQFFVSFNQVF